MKTLKDFYIVVTKQNKEELKNILNIKNLFIDMCVQFESDDKDVYISTYSIPENKERISLSKLKRYIDNTPTRKGLKNAQNASKLYKYKYEQCKKENEEQAYYIEEFRLDYNELREDYNQVKSVCTALDYKLTERNNNLKELQTTLRSIEKIVMPDACEKESTIVDWVSYIVDENKEQAYYIEEFRSELKELSHSNERLQDNLDNLRTEREQLTNLAKKDVNLGKKTLVEWVKYIQENNKYMYKECTVLGISNKNLELNNTKLNLENDNLNKELRKYKIVTMCSLLLTLLALGLWF